MCECLHSTAHEVERYEDTAQEAHGKTSRVADKAECSGCQVEVRDQKSESADVEGGGDQVQNNDPAVLAHHVGVTCIDEAEDSVDQDQDYCTGHKAGHLSPGLPPGLYRCRFDPCGNYLLICGDDRGGDGHAHDPEADEAEVIEDHVGRILICIRVLRFLLLCHDTEGDLRHRHVQCFFRSLMSIHAHRAVASVDVYERIDIVGEAEGLTGHLAVGGITQRDVLTGVDLLLEVLRYLDEEIRDGEIQEVIDGLFRRSVVIFDVAVIVDQFSDSCGKFAIIIITEKHSQVLVIDIFFARACFILVDDMRSRKDHRSGVNEHDNR